jgi:hypothetical protein
MPLPLSRTCMSGTFADISTESVIYFSAPYDGYLESIQLTLLNAITGAPAIVTVEVDTVAKGTALSITHTDSAAGTTFRREYQNVPVKRGSLIEVLSDGASSTTCITPCTITFRP